MNRIIAIVSVSIIGLAALSCAGNTVRSIPKDYEITNIELNDKIPLQAGLYLKPSFKGYSYIDKFGVSPIAYVYIPMGEALQSGSFRALKNIFRDVVLIEGNVSDILEENIDVVVTPEIPKTDSIKVPGSGFHYLREVKTSIKWNIVSTDGKEIYVTTVTGEGNYRLTTWVFGCRDAALIGHMQALKDHFTKVQRDFFENNWWRKQWWRKDETKPVVTK